MCNLGVWFLCWYDLMMLQSSSADLPFYEGLIVTLELGTRKTKITRCCFEFLSSLSRLFSSQHSTLCS